MQNNANITNAENPNAKHPLLPFSYPPKEIVHRVTMSFIIQKKSKSENRKSV
jgi:hypothetical protein